MDLKKTFATLLQVFVYQVKKFDEFLSVYFQLETEHSNEHFLDCYCFHNIASLKPSNNIWVYA